jgi:acyl CoA:acetate/3-ketoacid CoA transferase beta subunit
MIPGKMVLIEVADGVSLEEITAKTGADFDVRLSGQ